MESEKEKEFKRIRTLRKEANFGLFVNLLKVETEYQFEKIQKRHFFRIKGTY